MRLPVTPDRMKNRLLNRLPNGEFKFLTHSEKTISLAQGEEVYRQDGPGSLSHVYFPMSGVIALTVRMEDGKEVETATIGNEGMIGLPLALGLDSSPIRAVSQISGEGLQIPAPVFLKAMKPSGTLNRLVRRYTAYSLRYANQTVACNLLHSVEQRMCRWLLMSHDRVEKDEFLLTHELLAEMLCTPPDGNSHRRDAAKGGPADLSPGRHPCCQPGRAGSCQLRVLPGHFDVLRPHHEADAFRVKRREQGPLLWTSLVPQTEKNCSMEWSYIMDAQTVEAVSQTKPKELAERCLRSNSNSKLKNVSCDYLNGLLVLRGCVETYYLKQLAQEVVARVEGVERIDNQIQVAASGFPITSGLMLRAE